MDEAFRVEHDGDSRLRLSGELDMSTADELAAALEGTRDAHEVTIDLTDLTFIDSSGIQVLLRFVASRNGHARRAGLVLEGAAPNVRRAFEIVGIDRVDGVKLLGG